MRRRYRRPVSLLVIIAATVSAAIVLTVTAVAVGLSLGTPRRAATRNSRARVAAASVAVAQAAPSPAIAPSQVSAEPTVPAPAATPVPPSSAAASPTPSARTVKRRAAAPSAGSADAYRGLGSWIDIYDGRAWSDPAGAVRDMASHGVRTLFIETANSRAPSALNKPAALGTFISEAHARHMLVVAWYLPDLKSQALDYSRVAQAIRFQTPDGQRFDSFALDIESGAVHSVKTRNARLANLSGKIRGLVGSSYPLGAIIPSPGALSKKRGYWDAFPYTTLAKTYDVFVPMSYYTYHGHGEAAAYADTLLNVRVIRAQKGCSRIPIHLIGGIAENSSASQVRGFVRAEVKTRVLGASLYGWIGTSAADWRLLKGVRP